MSHNPEQAYLESKVYTATPGELVQMLYEASLEAVQQAIQAVDSRDIERRSRCITKASSCVMELAGSLNVEAGGELGVRLAVLYEYLLHELLEANVRQDAAPLRDCERVIGSLLEGWTTATASLAAETSAKAEAQAPASVDPPKPSTVPTGTGPVLLFQNDPQPFAPAEDEGDAPDADELEPAVNSWCG